MLIVPESVSESVNLTYAFLKKECCKNGCDDSAKNQHKYYSCNYLSRYIVTCYSTEPSC